MNLFLNRGFARYLSHYLIKNEEIFCFEAISEEYQSFYRGLIAAQDAFDANQSVSSINHLVAYIAKSKRVNERHYEDYCGLQHGALNLSDSDLLNLYAVAFNITNYQNLSFPAYNILFDHFHEIVHDIASKNNGSVILRTEHDIDAFEREIYSALSKYLIAFCPAEDVSVWGENYDDGSSSAIIEVEEGRAFEEYEQLNCYVEVTDLNTVNRVKRAGYLATYNSLDIEYGIMLIGNMITFVTRDLRDSVTVQIIDHSYFKSFEEMFKKLGPSSFGYNNETPEMCVDKTTSFFYELMTDTPLCLKVKRIERSILSKNDYKSLQSSYLDKLDEG